MTDRSIDEVVKDLQLTTIEEHETIKIEAELNRQMEQLRRQLNQLHEKKRDIRSKKSQLILEKASAERMEAIARQQAAIEAEIKRVKKEAQELIESAFWNSYAYDWQVDGALKLATAQRGILADTRGMGKTLSAVIWRRVTKSTKTLALTRRSLCEELVKEILRHAPETTVIPLFGMDTSQRSTILNFLKNQDNFIVVLNYESWRRAPKEATEDLLKVEFDSVIVDEAHRLKAYRSATAEGYLYLAEAAPKVLEMTGTPVQNRPQELFALLHPLYPDLFPNEKSFIWDYCDRATDAWGNPIPNRWTWKRGGLDRLMRKIGKFFVARTPEMVGHKIPPPAIHTYTLDFSGYEQQALAYKKMEQEALAQLTSGKSLPIMSQLALLTRLAQAVVWPAGIEFKIKDPDTDAIIDIIKFDVFQSVVLDWTEEFVQELTDENHRVIVVSRFVPPVNELYTRMTRNGLSVAKITGETSKAANEEVVSDFDLKTAAKNPKYQVLVATYDMIMEGLNLNAARHMIQLDRYWKPAADDQSIGRIDRLNSTDQATVHRPHVRGTIYDFMDQLIDQKAKMLSAFKAASIQDDFVDFLKGKR